MTSQNAPQRNALFDRVAATGVAHCGWTLSSAPGRTLRGTRLYEWFCSISPDGRTVRNCGHTAPGHPGVLCTDDPDPQVRCGPCAVRMAATLKDDRICHICGQESSTFREFTAQGTGQLIFCGNACRACFADLMRGRPAPEAGAA